MSLPIPEGKAMNLADGKLLYDDLRKRVEDVDDQVIVSDEQPHVESNELWIDTSGTGAGAEYEVPTHQEFTSALSNKANKSELHITPIFTPDPSNPLSYICNMSFQEVSDAVVNGKCDSSIFVINMGAQSAVLAFSLATMTPTTITFVQSIMAQGVAQTVEIGLKSNDTVETQNVAMQIYDKFAPTYAFNSGLFPVKKGEYCVNNDKLLKANVDIPVYEVFNSSKWDEVSVGEELYQIALNNNAMIANVEEDNTSDHAYAVGDIFIYDNKLYKATSAIAVNDYIIPNTNCVETIVSSALDSKEDKPGLIVTYTVTTDYDTGDVTATCDKTADEIGQVYDSGKKIEAIMIVDGFSQKAQLSVIKQGNIYACVASVASIFEGVLYICAFSFSGYNEVQAVMYEPMLSANGRDYTALTKKITYLGEPTASTDATTKNYVDTALAAKEDKPDLIVTYTISGNDTATCDKTIEEIGQAYDSGKNIEAVIIAEGQRFKTRPMILNPRPNVYICFVGTTAYLEGVIYIVLGHSSGSETIPVIRTEPMLSVDGAYTARSMKITQLANPTASTDAANKGYVDTALAAKEDKSFNATFNLTYDSTNDTWEATCNKTVAEIGAAYDAGKTVEARAIRQNGPFPEETKLTGNTLVSMSGQYMIVFSGRIFLNSIEGCVDINISGATSLPSWQVTLVSNKINDVQVNGTSVISNNVANIPYASSSTPGVVYIGNGLAMSSSGILSVQGANRNDATLKTGNSNNRSITPYNQDISVFYGLSKVAGVDLASETVTLGTYPTNAKTAIQNMIGVNPVEVVRLA